MMSSLNNPEVRRISALLNAAVVLLVLAGVFVGINWDQMPSGLGDFLSMRITVKNLLVAAVCLAGGAWAFHVFGLTGPASNAPFRKELINVTKACSVTAAFALLFPLTSHTGAFGVRINLYFVPLGIITCLSGRLMACAFAERVAHTLNGRRNLIIVGSGPRALRLYEQVRESKHHHTEVLGFVDSPQGHEVTDEIRRRMMGSLDELETILMRQPVEQRADRAARRILPCADSDRDHHLRARWCGSQIPFVRYF